VKWLALLLLVATAHASDVPKKDRVRAAKSAHHGAPPAPGTKPTALINLYNEHTHEWLAVDPTRSDSAPFELRSPSAATDHFLRDHYTNESIKMEPRLVPILIEAAVHFKVDTVYVVSAFRHPKFNLVLRKKGHQVARDSEHTHGNAIDFYLPNITTQQLHAWAKAQKLGGVGLYLESKFVHMDTGRIRFWTGD
jgi:uncharacterized protein YcbK (DUF882 family)